MEPGTLGLEGRDLTTAPTPIYISFIIVDIPLFCLSWLCCGLEPVRTGNHSSGQRCIEARQILLYLGPEPHTGLG